MALRMHDLYYHTGHFQKLAMPFVSQNQNFSSKPVRNFVLRPYRYVTGMLPTIRISTTHLADRPRIIKLLWILSSPIDRPHTARLAVRSRRLREITGSRMDFNAARPAVDNNQWHLFARCNQNEPVCGQVSRDINGVR